MQIKERSARQPVPSQNTTVKAPVLLQTEKPSPMALFPWMVAREWMGSHPLVRVPEPHMALEDQSATAFANAGIAKSALAATYVFVAGHLSETIQNCRKVLDLCCGPANQLAVIASLHPTINFVGVDLSADMLTIAEKHVKDMGLKNVRFELGNVCQPDGLPAGRFDGVMSTLALHHLPTLENLRDCFEAVGQVLKPNGAVFLFDLGRLKTEQAIMFLSRMNADTVSPEFIRDYEYSLRAAFLPAEFAQFSDLIPARVTVHSTRPLPVTFMMRTEGRPLSLPLQARLKALAQSLAPQSQRDLNLLRFLFRLGGLKRDPFKGGNF